MLENKTRYATKEQLLKYIDDCTDTKVKDMTGYRVLSILFDHTDGWYGQYRIINTDYDVKQTMYHRLNKLWAYPFTLIIASPYRYIRYGGIGWDDKTRFGKWILTVCGER